MANLSNVIKISKTDYNTLVGGGTITKNGVTYSYDPNAIYLIAPEAVGSATQPVYVNNNGDLTAGNTMVDLTSTQTITGTKTFSQFDSLKTADLTVLDYYGQGYFGNISVDDGEFYFADKNDQTNPVRNNVITLDTYNGAIKAKKNGANNYITYTLPTTGGTLALTSDIPSGITEISTQYTRITDLDTGIYKLTYNGTKYLYYSGTSATTTHTVGTTSNPCIIYVTRRGTNAWSWYYMVNTAIANSTAPYIYFGITNATSGSTGNRQLDYIPSNKLNIKIYRLTIQDISSMTVLDVNFICFKPTSAFSGYEGFVIGGKWGSYTPEMPLGGKITYTPGNSVLGTNDQAILSTNTFKYVSSSSSSWTTADQTYTKGRELPTWTFTEVGTLF